MPTLVRLKGAIKSGQMRLDDEEEDSEALIP
jgi:hypothetical protein